MANWFYYNEEGEKIAVTGGELKSLAKAGMITRDTIVETEEGKQAPARRVKGLTFIQSTTHKASEPVEPNTNQVTVSLPTDQTATPVSPSVPITSNAFTDTKVIEIIIDGTTKSVTKQELFGLMTSGKISADTPVSVAGKLVTVEMVFTMDSTEAVRPATTTQQPVSVLLPIHTQQNISNPIPQPLSVHNDTTTSRSRIVSQIGKKCWDGGCSLFCWGFVLSFMGGFILAITNESDVGVVLFWILIGIGSFMFTVAPIMLVIGYILPEDPAIEQERKKHADLTSAGLMNVFKYAEQGHVPSQFRLGECYYMGQGVPEDKEEGVKWFRKAAEQGHVEAQCLLGDCYYGGQGVPDDKAEAAKWYRKAAEQGHVEAQGLLGVCLILGVPDDKAEAVKWLRKAAEQGHAEAQNLLGNCYYRGLGVPDDKAEAVKWWDKAAEQGSAGAIKSLLIAAEEGYATAQFNIGERYIAGRGLPKNVAEGKLWIGKAAKQGHQGARELLWLME